MKQIRRQLALIAFGLMVIIKSFAAEGIKTTINGSVDKKEIKIINLFKREMRRRPEVSGAVKPNGQFQLMMNLKTAGFYRVTDSADQVKEFEMYITPGDQISMKVENGTFIMSGKGSGLNQLLYDIQKKYAYSSTDPTSHFQTYTLRNKAINSSTNSEVIAKRALLLGNAQGEYLNEVYGALMESKIHPNPTGIVEAKMTDLNLQLLPEIMVYPSWKQLLIELMYAKMNAGQLKVNTMKTWVADFGQAIANQKLRESFVAALLENSVLQADLVSINDVIKAALPLIKDPQKMARVNQLKIKAAEPTYFYKCAKPGTDLSSYTFKDINGKQVAISDFKEKFIFIDIWTTGCMPCMAEAPYLKKLEHEMQGKDIVFLSISCDSSAEVWKRTMKQYNLTGGEQLLMNGYNDPFFVKVGKSGVPRFMILDKEGKMFDYNCEKRPSNPLLKIYLTELTNPSK